jgi:hypothetical protein
MCVCRSCQVALSQANTAQVEDRIWHQTPARLCFFLLLAALQIPLLHTLPNTSTASREATWYSLMRRTGEQHVTGQVQVGIHSHSCMSQLCAYTVPARLSCCQTVC